MDDLNAPLGMHRKPKTPESKNRPAKTATNGLVGTGIFLASLILINLFALRSEEQTLTQIVQLPEPIVEQPVTASNQVNAPTEVASSPTPEVEVVYGDGNNSDLADNGTEDLPVPLPGESEIDVSPGGAKIITIRDPTMVQIGQSPAEAHLPYSPAIEETDQGPLPKIADDGRRPFDIYARPWSSARGKRIAIVIGGLGLSQTGTQRAIQELPAEITLAFAPTGFSLDRWMQAARKKGHELLVQIPMEPFNYPEVNPGPNTLRLASSPETNIENLHWALAKITNYTGVVNYLGARFIADQSAMGPILEDLGERGLLYFNDGSNGASANLGGQAAQANVPYAASNLTIDTSNDPQAIRAKLKALESIADARGDAIGYGSALELTVSEVAQWANEAKKNGFEIVGIAAMARGSE